MRLTGPVGILGLLGAFGFAVVFPLSTAGAAQAGTSSSSPIGSLRAAFADPGATADDGFGVSVAKWGSGVGSTVVVGADGANSSAGAAYIYVRGSGWLTVTAPSATLADPAATSGDYFGFSVAVSGNTAVVGAWGTNSFAGAAYIYVKGTSGWPTKPTVTLADPATTSNDGFGFSVAVSGNTAVVGAPGTNSSAGAAYVYVKGTSGWPTKPRATLADPATTSDDKFGSSVAVSGNTAVVGALGTNFNTGAAYIYAKGTSGWPTTPTATLANPPTTTSNNYFGCSVAVSGNTAVVGAYGTNVGPNLFAGAAYIYVKDTSGWPTTPTAALADPADTRSDGFGFSVAISGNTAVVGASNQGSGAGAAYIYANGTSGWPIKPRATLADPAATSNDFFGASVAVSGHAAVIGAYGTTSYAGAANIFTSGPSD
jgi:hypothetical protein